MLHFQMNKRLVRGVSFSKSVLFGFVSSLTGRTFESVATSSRCCAFFVRQLRLTHFYLEEFFMNYKEEYFEMFEALGDAKVALEYTLDRVKRIQDEVLVRFAKNNDSREDVQRMRQVLLTEGER